MIDSELFFEQRTGSTELVVLLHGFGNGSNRLADVREVITKNYPLADMYAPELGTKSFWCRTPSETMVAEVTEAIDAICARRAGVQPYRTITLVGHSIGAVFARKISIIAHGEQRDANHDVPAPFEPRLAGFRDKRDWANSIRRIVLLAGMNRGWSPASGRDWLGSVVIGIAQFIGECAGGTSTIFSIRQGAPFLVQTRLQWLALMNADYGGRPDMTVVQLLGSVDDEVAPDDSIDFAIDDVNNSDQVTTYNYLEVRHSGHSDIVQMSETGSPATAQARAERRAKFMCAFAAPPDELSLHRISRTQMQDTLPPPPDPLVKDMVFVIHGIRDKGFWTKKVARTIKAEAGARRFESWTESYGYFAMLPFLSAAVRQRKVEWLMDCYCEARARYPNATFHYVGHSNGTYLAAKALLDYPAVRFSRIVFAGSVVRRDYDWDKLIVQKRVDQVLNYVATRDWVVAIFPKGLQGLRSFDLGSAGHDGFDAKSVHQVSFIDGAHGIGHEEGSWNDIARFVVHGQTPALAFPPFSQRQSTVWRLAGRASGVILAGAAAAVIGVTMKMVHFITAAPTPAMAALQTAAFVAYLWILRLIFTRF